MAGRVEITIEVATNNRRDLDNYNKPVIDLLVSHRLIKTDRMSVVRRVTAEASDEIEGVRVSIRNTNR